MFVSYASRDRENLDARTKSASIAADKGWAQAQFFAATCQCLAIKCQQRLVLVHGIAGAVGVERDRCAPTEARSGLFKRLLDCLQIAFTRLWCLKAAQFFLD